MKPSVGRIIHVEGEAEGKCLAAIITDITHAGDDPPSFNATVFTPNGASSETARRIAIWLNAPWHNPLDCTGSKNNTWHLTE